MKDVFLRLVTLSLTCSVVLLPLPSVLPQAPVTVSLPSYTVEIPARPPAAPAAPAAPAVPMAPDAAWKPEIGVFLAWQIVGYLLARRRFSRGAPEYREGAAVYRSLRVCTPVAMGLLRPVIFLPAQGMDGASEAVALSHELCHIGRHDLWYKALFLLVNAVHWFNPLAWLMARESSRNVELRVEYFQGSYHLVGAKTRNLWPVEGEYRINSHFWLGEHNFTGTPGDHTGCDISAPAGTPVRVVAGGTVTEVSDNSVFVEHNDRLQTRYAGLKDVAVTVGETVERGTILGAVWDTVEKPAGLEPFHDTTSLHYEYLVDGQWVNPLDGEYFNYVKANGTALSRGDLNAPQW